MYSYREKTHPIVDFIFSFKFIYILINVLEFTSDWREGKQSPEKNINLGEFGVNLPPNPSTPVSYRNF